LVEQRHLQQVAADSHSAAALLASAGRHVDSARRTVDTDPEAAYALAYDAARTSATALLAHQGLRPTTSGGHIAVVDAIRAQFPGVPGLTSLDRLRRRRNQAEYPNPTSYGSPGSSRQVGMMSHWEQLSLGWMTDGCPRSSAHEAAMLHSACRSRQCLQTAQLT
jgi:hypothetical protein